MSPRPHDGTAEEGLASSLLPIVQDEEQVERLRALLGGFCHRGRNALNGITMSLYLFRREARGAAPECWGQIESIYHQVEQLFDRLQTIYRPMRIAAVRSPLEDLIRQHEPRWRSWYETRGMDLRIEPPESEVAGDFDPGQLGAGLDAMASWRAEAGRPGGRTRVAWCGGNGWIEVDWREEPPDHDRRQGGGRTDFAARDEGPGPGRPEALALPLLARVVAAHGGRLDRRPGPDFAVTFRWPQHRRVDAAGALDGDVGGGITCPSAAQRGA